MDKDVVHLSLPFSLGLLLVQYMVLLRTFLT
jgi:hypothetical protein